MSKAILLILIFKLLVLISLTYIASLLNMTCACGSRAWTRDRRGRFCVVCGEGWGEQYSHKTETVSEATLLPPPRLLAESQTEFRKDSRR
jgi:hypothetical protein